MRAREDEYDDLHRKDSDGFTPTKWFRVLDAAGILLCETSNRHEAERASYRAGNRPIERLWQRAEYKWVQL